MVRIVAVTSIVLVWAVALLLVHPMLTESQPSKPLLQLNNVIQDVLKAESAGGRSEELEPLIYQLNSVISLQDQLQNVGPRENSRRSQLLDEINSTLAKVEIEANQLEATASQRTYTSHLLTYSFGGIGALLVTIASHYTFSLWRRYRAKRALHLKIAPK